MARTSSPARPQRRAPQRPSRRQTPRRGRLVALGAVVAIAAVAAVVASRGGDEGASPTGGDRPAGLVGPDFHSLVIDPTTPGRLFVGGHQAVSTSVDGGRSWTRVESLDDADAMGWSFTDKAVYVSGHPGIGRSTDGAATFRRANDGLPDTDVHAFGATNSTLYAAGPGIGVIASTDGGATWTPRTSAAGRAFFGRILTGPGDNQLIAADARTGAVESTDGGRTWRPLGGPPGAVWVSRSGQALYVSTQRGVARTVDGGKTWEQVTLPNGATLVEADPDDPNVLYAGVHRGDAVTVWRSGDAGETWTRP